MGGGGVTSAPRDGTGTNIGIFLAVEHSRATLFSTSHQTITGMHRHAWAIIFLVTACVTTARGQIDYSSQERYIQVQTYDGTVRHDAVGFLPFDDSVELHDPASDAVATQRSTLGEGIIEGSCDATGYSHYLLGFAYAQCRIHVEFDLAQPSPFVLDGNLFSSSSNEGNNPYSFASFSITGPEGDIVNLSARPNQYIHFDGLNSIIGVMPPGHYVLDGYLHPGNSAGNYVSDARLDFTLTLPAPSSALLLLAIPYFVRRSRT